MDEFRERLTSVFKLIEGWFEFGRLLVLTALAIPMLIVFGIVFLVLPIAYLVIAVQQPILVALYLLAVFGGVAAYMLLRSNDSSDDDDPHQGRPMLSEEKAFRKSKSLIDHDSSSRHRRNH